MRTPLQLRSWPAAPNRPAAAAPAPWQPPPEAATVFEDLATFAALEVASGDLEPWATFIKAVSNLLPLSSEQSIWLTTLYNTYDSFSSAWEFLARWPSPAEWAAAPNRADAAKYYCTQERRNLRGGQVLRRLESYAYAVGARKQLEWLAEEQPDFLGLMRRMRTIWGVGRQSAFEWAEFLAKVNGFQVTAPDAQLWESEGPRRSLQLLFGNPTPTQAQLEEYAVLTRDFLAARGVSLPWEDLETVICDFHVMRLGRYYPGRHLAALRGEIDEVTDPQSQRWLREVFDAAIPSPWNRIPPNINKALLPYYRDTGRILRLDIQLA